MNLAPLYRITDESVKRELADLKKHPEKIDNSLHLQNENMVHAK